VALLAAQPLVERAGADGRWLVALRGVPVAALLLYFRRDYVELCAVRAPRTQPSDWILAIVLGFAVFLAWIHLDFPIVAFRGRAGFDPSRGNGLDWPLLILRWSSLALVVPVMEELFWRSFLMRWIASREFLLMDPKKVGAGAFVISSALFASEHSMWLAGLLAGLAYGWLYVRTANLWIPVLSHTITNGTLGLWILATGQWRFW
jgi:CAAX prenyl protease-like protein